MLYYKKPNEVEGAPPTPVLAMESLSETLAALNILRSVQQVHRHRRDLQEVVGRLEQDVVEDIGVRPHDHEDDIRTKPGKTAGRDPQTYMPRTYEGGDAEVIQDALEEVYLLNPLELEVQERSDAEHRRQEAVHMLTTAGIIGEHVAAEHH